VARTRTQPYRPRRVRRRQAAAGQWRQPWSGPVEQVGQRVDVAAVDAQAEMQHHPVPRSEPPDRSQHLHSLPGAHLCTKQRSDCNRYPWSNQQGDPPDPGHRAGELHPATSRRPDHLPDLATDVDAAMARPIRSRRVEPSYYRPGQRHPQRRHPSRGPGRPHHRPRVRRLGGRRASRAVGLGCSRDPLGEGGRRGPESEDDPRHQHEGSQAGSRGGASCRLAVRWRHGAASRADGSASVVRDATRRRRPVGTIARDCGQPSGAPIATSANAPRHRSPRHRPRRTGPRRRPRTADALR
jgi:hypothetical protein